MGWTFMEKPRDVRGELDRQYSWTNEGTVNRVIDSAIVNRAEYYCAVETVKPDGSRSVWAGVVLLKFVPRASDGLTFGYKDMAESMGPYVSRCPVRILDLLTETDNQYANAWRERCRAYHARRAALPKLSVGMRLRVKDAPGLTIGGAALEECTVIRAGRTPLFSVGGYGSFRWPSWRQYNVEAVA